MGLTVYGGGGKPEEEKTVTAGTSTKVVTPSEGKTIKKVTVNPTPSQSKTVTPSTSQQTVSPDSGKLLSKVIVKAMEDVTPEVTAQTPVISQILEGLVGKAQGANATAETILKGFSAYVGQTLVNGTATKSGQYVWKKLTAQGGDFVDFVTDDLETKYPDEGTQDGYWYEKVVEGVTGIAFGEVTIASKTLTFEVEHGLKSIPKVAYIIGFNNPKPTSAYLCIEVLSSSKIFPGSYGDVYGIVSTGSTSEIMKSSFSKELTAQKIKFTSKGGASAHYFGAGCTYYWFALA